MREDWWLWLLYVCWIGGGYRLGLGYTLCLAHSDLVWPVWIKLTRNEKPWVEWQDNRCSYHIWRDICLLLHVTCLPLLFCSRACQEFVDSRTAAMSQSVYDAFTLQVVMLSASILSSIEGGIGCLYYTHVWLSVCLVMRCGLAWLGLATSLVRSPLSAALTSSNTMLLFLPSAKCIFH